MKTKVLQVFYNENGLPFKDQERTVHFPIVGSGFMGASNTTQIKFYFKEIGDDAVKYVAVSKLPNGKVGSKVLENYFDTELNEPYALLELDSYYTQYKGDLFISLQGYQGGVQVNYNEETELYEISGTPTIQATGSIKFTNNYATQFVGSGEEQNITLQQLLAIISDTVLRYYVNSNSTLAEVFNEIGTKICAIDIEGDEYLCEMSGDTNIVIYDIHNQEWYAFSGANTTTIDTVLSDQCKHTVASKEYVDDNVFEMTSNPMTLTQSQVDYLIKSNARIKYENYYFEHAIVDNDNDHVYICTYMPVVTSSNVAIAFPYIVLATTNMTLAHTFNHLQIYNQEQADNLFATKQELADFGNLFTYKGTASVSEINALTNIGNGWCYNLTDSGTLTLGNLQVETGDNVAFNGTIWTKLSSETVLGNYYTKEEGQTFESGIDNRVTSVENELSSVASGSPAGVYATVSDLTTADPDHSKIYLVSADGHWYYWSGSAWSDGGVYQVALTGFAPCKLVPPYTVSKKGFITYDTINNKIIFPQYTMIINSITGGRYEVGSETEISIGAGSSAMVMIFKWSTTTYSVVPYNQLTNYNNSDYSIVFTIRTNIKQLGIDIPYNVDDKPFGLYHKYDTYNSYKIGGTTGLVDYSPKNKTVTFPPYFCIASKDFYYETNAQKVLDLSSFTGSSALKLYFDTSDNSIHACYRTADVPESGIIFGGMRQLDNSNYQPQLDIGVPYTIDGVLFGDAFSKKQYISNKSLIKTIQHRGWNTYPENTIIAFKKDIELGYIYFETDVELTSDGVAVLLHDATINRTARNADGTTISGDVYISQITYEQALTYDFGIYKGAQFAGTKIATLDDFVKLCKVCGIKPYIELKNYSNTCGDEVIRILKKYDMLNKTTITSFSYSALSYIASKSNKLRIGLAIDDVTSSTISNLSNIKSTYGNECILFANETRNYGDYIDDLITNDIRLELWTVDYDTQYNRMNLYVSGVLSNTLNVSYIMYEKGMN